MLAPTVLLSQSMQGLPEGAARLRHRAGGTNAVYTFGTPALGNIPFTNFFTTKVTPSAYQVVRPADVVAGIFIPGYFVIGSQQARRSLHAQYQMPMPVSHAAGRQSAGRRQRCSATTHQCRCWIADDGEHEWRGSGFMRPMIARGRGWLRRSWSTSLRKAQVGGMSTNI